MADQSPLTTDKNENWKGREMTSQMVGYELFVHVGVDFCFPTRRAFVTHES